MLKRVLPFLLALIIGTGLVYLLTPVKMETVTPVVTIKKKDYPNRCRFNSQRDFSEQYDRRALSDFDR
jgi:hypothetical protein